jgi:hypothetical protein
MPLAAALPTESLNGPRVQQPSCWSDLRAPRKNGGDVDRPLPWLRYIDASSLDNEVIDFDRLYVESPTASILET